MNRGECHLDFINQSQGSLLKNLHLWHSKPKSEDYPLSINPCILCATSAAALAPKATLKGSFASRYANSVDSASQVVRQICLARSKAVREWKLNYDSQKALIA